MNTHTQQWALEEYDRNGWGRVENIVFFFGMVGKKQIQICTLPTENSLFAFSWSNKKHLNLYTDKHTHTQNTFAMGSCENYICVQFTHIIWFEPFNSFVCEWEPKKKFLFFFKIRINICEQTHMHIIIWKRKISIESWNYLVSNVTLTIDTCAPSVCEYIIRSIFLFYQHLYNFASTLSLFMLINGFFLALFVFIALALKFKPLFPASFVP